MTLPRCFGGPFWFTALLAGALGVYLPQARAAEPIAPRDALLHVPLNPQAAQALAPATGIPARLQLPDGSGPFPLVYLHHERRFYTGRHPRYEAAARYFLGRGFAVVTPVRAGYGALDALGDRESLRCRRPDPGRIFASSTLQAAAVLEGLSALGQPIDRQRVLHVGVGVGGFAALSAAALSPQGVLGAVNFWRRRGWQPGLVSG